MKPAILSVLVAIGLLLQLSEQSAGDDFAGSLQSAAIASDRAEFGHWGTDPDRYTQWRTHSNRLIPVYTFGTRAAGHGIDLNDYTGSGSPYRSEEQLQRIFGRVPEGTLNPDAVWMDQTNIADIQRAALRAGRRYLFLIIFDGMDYQTTRAAALFNQGKDTYSQGKGTGTHFQNYDADGTAQYGFMVTSPHNTGTDVDVDLQTVTNPGGETYGGYDASLGGAAPWESPSDPGYLVSKPADGNPRHAYTDSASSATSMTTGVKTYNNSINVGPRGEQLSTVAHEAQQQGFAVGAVTSVPISHATPAAAYAHNVARKDYQDISRDLLGLASIAHPETPLPGLDVLIGCGIGRDAENGKDQGANFRPGNIYLADEDLKRVDVSHGGKYVTAIRTQGVSGRQLLDTAAARARTQGQRLLGYFGMSQYNGHLPFQTADGGYDPVRGVSKKPEAYTAADRLENPTLAQMTESAISVLSSRKEGFWLMVEAGDVDWANHDNNIDNSIGAVNSGDAAVRVITNWVEANSNWNEALVIVTADHGHRLNIVNPELLTRRWNVD